jgi:plastocyanin
VYHFFQPTKFLLFRSSTRLLSSNQGDSHALNSYIKKGRSSLRSLIFLMPMFLMTSLFPVALAQNETLSVTIVPGSSSPFNGQFYVPNAVTVSPTTSISWTNQDTSSHTITSGDFTTGPSGQFDSGLLNTGTTFTHQFTTQGVYTYYCTIFPFMSGVVNVTAP